MKKNKPELVCPAGEWASLVTAIESGADSVYFGIKGLTMRNLATNFDLLELPKIMRVLHKNKKKGYLALNVIIKNKELSKIEKILDKAKQAEVDAIILWDMAVFSLARQRKLPIHLSTQASVSNTEALSFFARQGARRVILARECSLFELQDIITHIRKQNLKCEIETFIHGAMCISISGRCFLSQYAYGKSANRGECLQLCRREFLIKDLQEDEEFILGKDYILSAKDLCTIDFIDVLIKAGVSAFKIEGRMRSPEYIKVVTTSYRRAIDLFFAGKLTDSLKKRLKKELKKVYTRGFSSGFYFGSPRRALSTYLAHQFEKIYLGEIKKFYKKISVAEVILHHRGIQRGDEILCVGKNTPANFTVINEIQKQHIFVERAHKGESVGLKLPFTVKAKDKVFLWQRKYSSQTL